jgi:hypothetical protein
MSSLRNRTLDRQVHHVDHQPAAVEAFQRRLQRGRARQVIEGEHPLHPSRAGQPFGLLRQQPGSGGDDQDVVAQHTAVFQHDPVPLDVDPVHAAVAVADTTVQLTHPGPREIPRLSDAERQEQQPRLIDVVVVAVNNRDRHIRTQLAPQPVRRDRAAGTATENYYMLGHTLSLQPSTRHPQGHKSPAQPTMVALAPAAG